MPVTKLPPKEDLVDQQVVSVEGPDGIIQNWIYDAGQNAFYMKIGPVTIPPNHGLSHIGEDPIPEATCDSKGLMSADDKCKLDNLVGVRLGVLGFSGAGFPDDGGWLNNDVILAAGSDFITLERVGNVIRFIVDSPSPITCNCESCNQVFWVQDESDVSSIRPPVCNGKLPGANTYGEVKFYLFPASTVATQSNVSTILATKGNYPSFSFSRYAPQVGTGQLNYTLQRSATNLSQAIVGHSMTPGQPTGIVECVWFTGLDTDGNLTRFDFRMDKDPGIMGMLAYKGHSLTKQLAVITGYTDTTLTANTYTCKMWDQINATTAGDEFTATNTWQYNELGTTSQNLASDKSLDLLAVGTVVDIWSFQISTDTSGRPVYRRVFIKQPSVNADDVWVPVGCIEFGNSLVIRAESNPTSLTAGGIGTDVVSDAYTFENQAWGLSSGAEPLVLLDNVASAGTSGSADLNVQHRAEIDMSIPGLVVNQDAGTEPFSQRPVFLWNRTSLDNNALLRIDLGRPGVSGFPPYDILLASPVDSHEDLYLRVVNISTVDGLCVVRVHGAEFGDIPKRGTARALYPAGTKGLLWSYTSKYMFPSADDIGIVLASTETYTGAVGDIIELLRDDYDSNCVRLQFGTGDDDEITLQVKVGTLGMGTPYELNASADYGDDLVRGMKPGYAVSAVYSQAESWDGTGTRPTSVPSTFYLVDGSAGPTSGEVWNTVEIMHKGEQVWVWWNGLLIPPSAEASAALDSPVEVETPYFPLSPLYNAGKYGLRMWPGAVVRRLDVRAKAKVFSPFYYGQLALS